MKPIINLLIICSLQFLTFDSSGQNNKREKFYKEFKEAFVDGGYRVLEEGGLTIYGENILGLDERTYQKNKTYMIAAFVSNCNSCPISLKYATPGQIPAYLPALKTKKVPKSELNMTVLTYGFKRNNPSRGYYVLFNNSSIRRYAHTILFVKDN